MEKDLIETTIANQFNQEEVKEHHISYELISIID